MLCVSALLRLGSGVCSEDSCVGSGVGLVPAWRRCRSCPLTSCEAHFSSSSHLPSRHAACAQNLSTFRWLFDAKNRELKECAPIASPASSPSSSHGSEKIDQLFSARSSTLFHSPRAYKHLMHPKMRRNHGGSQQAFAHTLLMPQPTNQASPAKIPGLRHQTTKRSRRLRHPYLTRHYKALRIPDEGTARNDALSPPFLIDGSMNYRHYNPIYCFRAAFSTPNAASV